MDTCEFEAELLRDGFLDVKTKTVETDVDLGPHCHAFDTRLLVLEGEATIVCDGVPRVYREGEVMVIDRAVAHEERFGQTRFRFMVGLRHGPAGKTA